MGQNYYDKFENIVTSQLNTILFVLNLIQCHVERLITEM
jgi:hypothetical protein